MMGLFLGGPLYEVAVAGPDLEVLLRHRAVLLTLVGAALIALAFLSRLRAAAMSVAAALLGMASGRLIGRLFDKQSGFYPIWLYFWVELLGGASSSPPSGGGQESGRPPHRR
ncbi:hypothetical protein ACIBQX_26630 [Nonomuraea sp. NPDC049714]|uniref:hypothetical protein n=1 Tax=Nonomuraea sp. NPDC049714 TaxID=3364357 RepID=UPI0037B98426